jgi:hypothetical protein
MLIVLGILGLLAATIFFVVREDAVEGAITVRRLSCEPSSEPGIYILQVRAQNTTSGNLRNTEVVLVAGSNGERAHGAVQVPGWPRGEMVEPSVELAYPEELDTCAARFYTRSGTEIPAIYRP